MVEWRCRHPKELQPKRFLALASANELALWYVTFFVPITLMKRMDLQIEDIPTTGLQSFILKLAHENGVQYVRDGYSDLAQLFTCLSGDDIRPDETEQLVIALRRAKVINGHTMVALLGRYLDETRQV